VEIYQEFTFDAAHHFPGAPKGHLYHGLHGHSFTARVVLRGPKNPETGFIADLGDVEARCGQLRLLLDHKYLNDIDGLNNPSLENITAWIWARLKADLPALARVEVRRDSCHHGCAYEGG
jgi:6-pyruvoyltetrahydropterin/6-carboxytetrahydropterin synthase